MIMVVEKSTLLLCYAVSSGAFDLGFDVDCAHVAHAGIRAVHSYIRRMTIKSVILCTEKKIGRDGMLPSSGRHSTVVLTSKSVTQHPILELMSRQPLFHVNFVRSGGIFRGHQRLYPYPQ